MVYGVEQEWFQPKIRIYLSAGCVTSAVDWVFFTCKIFHLLRFHVVLVSAPDSTACVHTVLKKKIHMFCFRHCRVPMKINQQYPNLQYIYIWLVY